MKLQYHGPISGLEIVGLDVIVSPGDTFDAPSNIAGKAPTAAWLAAMAAVDTAEHAIPRVHNDCAAAKAALVEVMDGSGSGLLAQIDNFRPAASKADPKPSKDGE